MRDREYELRRISLPRTSVNKGKKKGRSTIAPALDDSLLGDPSYMPRVSATSFEKSV
jgi:hypothetical protein